MFDFNSKVDLARGVQKTIIRQVLATEDNLAHTFRIACTRNGAEEDLTGASVSGYFVRADGVTVSLVGSVDGSIASVTLNKSCYRVEGRCYLVIKLTKNGTVSTIFWGEGAVSLSQTGTIIDDGEITLSLEELLAKITDAETRITTAETQAEASAQAAASAEASALASSAAAVEAGNSAVMVKEACEAATEAALEAAERANDAADNSALLTRLEEAEAQINSVEAQADANAEAIAENTEEIATKANAAAVTPTTLWSGTWTSGKVTIANIDDWRLLQITTSVGAILAINAGTLIQAFGLSINTELHRTIGVRIEIASGGSCTLVTAHHLKHNESGSHATFTGIEVRAIVGLIKN